MLLPARYRRLANLSTAPPSGRPHRCGPALRAHSDRCPRPSAWPRSLRAVKSFPAFFIFKTHAAVDCVILQFGNDELRPSGLIPANNANRHQVDGANPGAAGTGGRALDGVTGRRQVSWFEWTSLRVMVSLAQSGCPCSEHHRGTIMEQYAGIDPTPHMGRRPNSRCPIGS